MRAAAPSSWVARLFQNRLALFLLLLGIQLIFLVINGLNAQLRAPTEGWEIRFPPVDDHITPHGAWLIPYFIGFFFTALVPLWAMFNMPNLLYRQFVLAMGLAALFSYVIYIFLPTYTTNPAPSEITGKDIFSWALRTTYESNETASSHNSSPSQHVFYALLNACFMIRFRPRPRVFWAWTVLAALILASTVLTKQHNVPDIVTGSATAIVMYYAGLALGQRITDRLGDADDPIRLPAFLQFERRPSRRTPGVGAP